MPILKVRHGLLELHRALVEEERRDYERQNGRATPGELLELLIKDASFAWLQPFTSLLVELDELEEEGGPDALQSWAARASTLLRQDAEGGRFQRRYDELIQRSPELLVAHGEAMRALRAS